MLKLLLPYAGPIIILCFLLITFTISAYEKINRWQTTHQSFEKMFKNTFVGKMISPVIVFLIAAEVMVVTFAALGIWDICMLQDLSFAIYAVIGSGLLYLVFLTGLRMIEDYAGAARIGVYLLISVFALYWMQSGF